MNEKISISKTAFSNLIGAFLPRDDDSGPWGPFGPVIRDRLLWILLNPQPLPPIAGPQPDPWHWFSGPVPDPWRLGPGPEPWRVRGDTLPWRSALIARFVIHQAVSQHQWMKIQTGGEIPERSESVIRAQIRDAADDLCPSPRKIKLPPPKYPWPWPNPPIVGPFEQLIIGAEFQKTAGALAAHPLHTEFSGAADRMFEQGIQGFESLGEEVASASSSL